MLPRNLSNSSLSEEVSASSGITRVHDFSNMNPIIIPASPEQQPRKKRNLPGNPEPNAEVIALSPRSLLETNRFVCEVCNKGFQRDQNLQLHRRGHNLPWKLNKRNIGEFRKKVYVCPEPSCVHHNPSRALGDLTGIKKHFCRKHREKRLKCHKCSKLYAVESDFKAHSKVCGTREISCECGRVFSRKAKYESHRPFCDALARETGRIHTTPTPPIHKFSHLYQPNPSGLIFSSNQTHPSNNLISSWDQLQENPLTVECRSEIQQQIPAINSYSVSEPPPTPQLNFLQQPNIYQSTINGAHMSATAILQQASNVGAGSISSGAAQTQLVGHMDSTTQFYMKDLSRVSECRVENGTADDGHIGFSSEKLTIWKNNCRPTRDFLGLAGEGGGDGGNSVNNDLLAFTRAVYFGTYDRPHSISRAPGFGSGEAWVGNY